MTSTTTTTNDEKKDNDDSSNSDDDDDKKMRKKRGEIKYMRLPETNMMVLLSYRTSSSRLLQLGLVGGILAGYSHVGAAVGRR